MTGNVLAFSITAGLLLLTVGVALANVRLLDRAAGAHNAVGHLTSVADELRGSSSAGSSASSTSAHHATAVGSGSGSSSSAGGHGSDD